MTPPAKKIKRASACCVPNCTSGQPADNSRRKAAGERPLSLFSVKEENLQKWSRLIRRGDKAIEVGDKVCELHFYPRCIVRFHPDLVINGKVIKGEPKPASLTADALPMIFPSSPSYLTIKDKVPRSSVKRQRSPTQTTTKSKRKRVENLDSDQGENALTSQRPASEDMLQSSSTGSCNEVHHQADIESSKNTPIISIRDVKLPGRDWAVHYVKGQIIIAKVNSKRKVTHSVSLLDRYETEVEVMGIKISDLSKPISTSEELSKLIAHTNCLKPCEGAGLNTRGKNCQGFCSIKAVRCRACKAKKDASQKKRNQLTCKERRTKLAAKHQQKRQERFRLKKCNVKLKQKVQHLKAQIQSLHKRCSEIQKSKVDSILKDLTPEHQLIVRACINAAKRKGPHGNRYEIEWVYECMLMRIKAPALYRHLYIHKKLPVPSRSQLSRYMKTLKPIYGFQMPLFEVLQKKTEDWPEKNKHGILMIDEMKIPPGIKFNKGTLEVTGFVDIGQYTPKEQRNVMGDHIAVIIFRPFTGLWYQSLGIFLSKSNIKGHILHKLLIEAIALLENRNIYVDAMVTDAAGWNRNMWERFGINSNNNKCENPHSEERNIYFLSDWCHILKCMRNLLCPLLSKKGKRGKNGKKGKRGKRAIDNFEDNPDDPLAEGQEDITNDDKSQTVILKEMTTPDGVVKRSHWIAVLEQEEKRRKIPGQLSYCPKLTRKHVFPTGFQRMNVGMAFVFFSEAVAGAMEFYRKLGIPELEDSEPTEKFIRRIHNVATAMNSNRPRGALWPGSTQEKAILEFEEYHQKCLQIAKSQGKKHFWSEKTDVGLTVTLRSTIELTEYLRDKQQFSYVMTQHFNSDTIEKFFCLMRQSAGPNNTPDPTLSAQLHRLLSVYSLVSPPKGINSNVHGSDNLKALMSANDPVGEEMQNKIKEFDDIIDQILCNGKALLALPLQNQVDHSYFDQPVPAVEEPIARFLAGFTAFRKKALVEGCEDCLGSLEKPHSDANSGDAYILTREMYKLTLPSDELSELLRAVEQAVLECMSKHGVHKDMAFTTAKYMRLDPSFVIGCIDHSSTLTKKLIKYYLMMRMFFAADGYNKQQTEKLKQNIKSHVKQSKVQ